MPLDRLKRKMTKEVMWLYVLTILKEKPTYAYQLKKEINEKFGWSPATITSYAVMYRLKRGGYVTTEWGDEGTHPRRKYYYITEEGDKLLNKGEEYLKSVIRELFES
ncbi:MAG: PadR family transcriptional regulator [Euryarchaeota archaeon]|nr:PadR family transcriptional regulator [Euryarchaeota archaeon]